MSTDAEIYEVLDLISNYGIKRAMEVTGKSKEELSDMAYPINELINSLEGTEEEGVNTSEVMDMNSDTFTPDYTATAKYEGKGKDDVKLGGLDMDPALLALVNPGNKAKAVGGMFSNLANKLMASKKLKSNQLKNRGSEGEVVKGASRKLKDSNLRPSIPNKTAERYKSMTDKVKKDRAVKAGTTAAAATAIGLSGNRDPDGNFVSAITDDMPREDIDLGRPDIYPEDDSKPKEETMGNQFGYHKKQGQNFWTVNNDDPYWDTHVIGTGDAWSDADVKKAPAKELDWSSWFN